MHLQISTVKALKSEKGFFYTLPIELVKCSVKLSCVLTMVVTF